MPQKHFVRNHLEAISEFQTLSLFKLGKVQNLSYENEFYLHENKNHFRITSFALSLDLKQRLGATWKWPIIVRFI